jgi:hypothetical protein
MARSSPEKLAAALRANLKRRKAGLQNPPGPQPPADHAESPGRPAEPPPKPEAD